MAQSLAASSVARAFLPQQQRCSSRQQRRMSSAAAPSGARRQAVVCSASIKFAKYQGLGNDFILVRGCSGNDWEASGCWMCAGRFRQGLGWALVEGSPPPGTR